MKPLYDLLHDLVKIHGLFLKNHCYDKLEHSSHIMSNTNHPIKSSFFKWYRCVLLQMNNKGKLDVIPYIFRFFLQLTNKKICTLYRDLFGIVNSLTRYELKILGSH